MVVIVSRCTHTLGGAPCAFPLECCICHNARSAFQGGDGYFCSPTQLKTPPPSLCSAAAGHSTEEPVRRRSHGDEVDVGGADKGVHGLITEVKV